ncbi:MAG: hypothetical protein Q7T77_04700 [Sulfuricurvum sp.]|nr:hypothetical protein [Sulfuricurvum sp.]
MGEEMKLELRIDSITTDDTDTVEDLELLCISKERYGNVELCFRGGGWNIPFAQIKLYNSKRAVDADAVFESAKFLGEEICRRWNLQNQRIGCLDELPIEVSEDNPLLKSFMRSSRE